MRRLGAIVVVAALSAVATGFGAGTARAATHGLSVVSLTTSVKSLPSGGGQLVLTARVRGATSCAFVGPLTPFASLVPLTTVPCASGHARTTIRVDANTRPENATLRYYVRAYDANGHNSLRESTIVELGSTSPGGKSPAGAMVVNTLTVPAAFIGSTYLTTLQASGGKGPFTWTLVSGSLPAGLALSPTGTITGVPNASGTSTFTVSARDSATTPASATATISLAVATPVGAPSTTPSDYQSTNWSGYDALGGPFSAATGTFTVPTLVPNGSEGHVSEWVGIDGVGASQSDLIQAGVEEDVDAGSNTVTTWAWWEILPAVATPISLTVAPGDTITVTITELSPGSWRITISDKTNGGQFSIDEAYSGPASSVEWIVEAPTSGVNGTVLPFTQYSPSVSFTGLGIVGAPTMFERNILFQSNVAVSTPSALTAHGFNTAYGSSTPSPP